MVTTELVRKQIKVIGKIWSPQVHNHLLASPLPQHSLRLSQPLSSGKPAQKFRFVNYRIQFALIVHHKALSDFVPRKVLIFPLTEPQLAPATSYRIEPDDIEILRQASEHLMTGHPRPSPGLRHEGYDAYIGHVRTGGACRITWHIHHISSSSFDPCQFHILHSKKAPYPSKLFLSYLTHCFLES